ncbi:TonB-dependent receptor plug domain-containing protein [Bacterioplanoides sp.]|uniref:TonB-dependent receptor plug domain-containing protein n=1 Tax=Bacterioplanoides sp. TaxID=2066072 RepID=UPI003B5CC6D4
MKPSTLLVSVILSTSAAQAAEVTSDELKHIALQYDRSLQQVGACTDQVPADKQAWQRLFDCLDIEHQALPDVLVTAQYIGPEVPEIQGRYRLSRDMIAASPKGGGDISELLDVLPGVYSGDETHSAEQQAEIVARRLSISGGQPWQTGFFLDGVNFNSRQDPAAFDLNNNEINDVAGSAQAMNINEQIVESIEVFDNNIPARYGSFSGGVVDVVTREASRKKFRYGVSMRGTNSDWNKYRIFYPQSEKATDRQLELKSPEFSKQSYSAYLSGPVSPYHSVLLSGNYLKSTVTGISLNESRQSYRENSNVLLKLTQENLWLDRVEWSTTYAPYENRNYLRDVRNSDITLKGGGVSSSIKLKQGFDSFNWHGRLAYSVSENSRQAPTHYYPWADIRGRDWGNGDEGTGTSVSREGGYGDLDKTQATTALSSGINDIFFNWGKSYHNVSAGLQLNHETLKRQRFRDTYVYNSPNREEKFLEDFNCSGFIFDCVERTTSITLEQLEQQLGEPFDENNPDHIIAREATIITAPQYFSQRRVYHQENIDVSVTNLGLYVEDSIDFNQVTLNLGLRYDYENFLRNHNIAPRISAGYRINGDANMLITAGLNRYYDSNLLTYKVREKRKPYTFQKRTVNDEGFVQGWQDVRESSGERYTYNDLRTPFSNELVLGWKHATGYVGTYAIKYIKRWREDQLVRGDERIYNEQDGFYYRAQTNDGSGKSERISLSWNYQINGHNLWANTSYQISESSSTSYDVSADDAQLSDLVILDRGAHLDENERYQETSLNSLSRVVREFGQPFTMNMGWNYRWNPYVLTSIVASYRQSFDTVRKTSNVRASEQLDRLCPSCGTGDEILLPIYEEVKVPERLLVNSALKVDLIKSGEHQLKLTTDIENLFNSRTHTVLKGDSGVETGRSFWLGISYDYK